LWRPYRDFAKYLDAKIVQVFTLDIIGSMNPKSATATLAVTILLGSEIVLHRRDPLVPCDHIHAEMHVDVVTTSVTAAFGGNPTIFDNEACSPARPWEQWWRADESQMAAAQGMLRLGQ
jgi:hypothetical protein